MLAIGRALMTRTDKIPTTVPEAFLKVVAEYDRRVAMRKKKYGIWHDIAWREYYQKVEEVGAGLIMIDEDNVVKYAQDHKVQFSTYRDLTQDAAIRRLIEQEIGFVNESLSRVEQVKKFTILPKKLYEEDGEITPTMKVKRKFVNEAFADLIDAMYRA